MLDNCWPVNIILAQVKPEGASFAGIVCSRPFVLQLIVSILMHSANEAHRQERIVVSVAGGEIMALKKSVFVVFCLLAFSLTACQSGPTSTTGTTAALPTETTAVSTPTPTHPATTEPPAWYAQPLGNEWVQAYGSFLYYVANGVLCRMKEDGSDPAFLIETDHYANGSLAVFDEQLFCLNRSLYSIERDGVLSLLLPECASLVTNVGDQLYYLSTVTSAHWPYSTLRSLNILNHEDALVSKIPADVAGGDQGILYLSYDLFSEVTNKSSSRLVRCLVDGSEEKQIDTGMIFDLTPCGHYLLYRKDIDPFRRQMWAYDQETDKRELLIDTETTENMSGQLEIAGVRLGYVYFYLRRGGASDVVYRLKPDGATTSEPVWDYNKEHGTILGLDLERDWLYYGKFQTLVTGNYVDYGRYARRSYRCRLDGSGRQAFCDRTAFDPVTIGNYIYFSSANQDFTNVALRRYNTQTGTIEDLPNGLLLKQPFSTK